MVQIYNFLFLDSEELERRTKETQKLQEEVENATREALKKFSCTYEDKSPRENCLNCRFNCDVILLLRLGYSFVDWKKCGL